MLFFRFGYFEDIGGWVEIIDVGNSTLGYAYLSPMSTCSSATMAATSKEVKRTFVFTFSPFSTFTYSIIKDY